MRNIKNDATFLSAKAYEELKRSIVHGELKAGVRLTETSLTEMLGVSRTPIREALRRLCYEGYLVRSNGYEVKSITRKDVRDILEVRRALECESARIAAKRITETQKAQLSANFARANDLWNIPDESERLDRFSLLDREFHTEIFEITGNSHFLRALKKSFYAEI
ncbi:MAG: GntR family transcriptional regulator [Lachnospiraceae bacterium]|nr:GntR family transcriptional regulator [Lachnospiraceae bacterium]